MPVEEATTAAEATDTTYVLEEQVGFLLRVAVQRHTALFAASMPEGLTPMQFSTLIKLSDVGECAQSRLGQLTAMDEATVKGVVDRLVERDLVATRRDAEDRRRRLVSLGVRGRALVPALRTAGHRITEATLAPLDAEERRVLVSLLARLG